MPAEAIECTGVNECLEDALVANAQIDALTEIEDARERLLRACLEHGIDRGASDVPDRAEAETNSAVANDGELVAGLVDIGRQDLQPKLARFGDVLHDAVGIANAAREQRRH